MFQKIGSLFSSRTSFETCENSVSIQQDGEARAIVVSKSDIHSFSGKADEVIPRLQRDFPGIANGVRLLLDERDYKAFPFEKPQVPETALNDAFRWAAKEHLDVPVGDLVFSWADIPIPENSGKTNCTIYCAKRSIVAERAKRFISLKIPVLSVDIPDESWRNLAVACGEPASSAFVIVSETSGRMFFFHEGLLVMSRRLPFGSRTIGDDEGLERAIIEIQRGTDFVDRQYPKMFVEKMFIPSFSEDTERFADAVRSAINTKVFIPDYASLGASVPSLNIRDLELLGSAISRRQEK